MQSIHPRTHNTKYTHAQHKLIICVCAHIYMNDDSALHTYRIYFWTGNEGKIQLKSIVVAFCCLFNVFTFYLVSRNGFSPLPSLSSSDCFALLFAFFFSCSRWFVSASLVEFYMERWNGNVYAWVWEKRVGNKMRPSTGVSMREVNRRWRIKERMYKIMLNETLLLCVSLFALIDRGTLFKFDGRKVLRNEKCLSHKARTLQGHWWQLTDRPYTPMLAHMYESSSYTPSDGPHSTNEQKRNSFWIFSIWTWLRPLMPNSTSKSKCGQFGHCTMGYP